MHLLKKYLSIIIRNKYEDHQPVEIFFDPLLGDIIRKVADPEMSSFSYHTVRLTHSLVHLHSNKLTVMALLITLLALPHYLIHCRGAPCHAAVCVLLACYSGPSLHRPSSHSASPAQCWCWGTATPPGESQRRRLGD